MTQNWHNLAKLDAKKINRLATEYNMIDNNKKISFDKVFPGAKKVRAEGTQEKVALTKKVAKALQEEKLRSIREQEEINISSRFFSTSI